MVSAALDKNFDEAERINKELSPLFEAIFIETNPIPIKAAMAMKGMCQEAYRLPLCEMRPENRERLKGVLEEMGILD